MPDYNEDPVPSFAQRILLILLAFILPPLPIIMLSNNNVFTKECLISIILTLLGHVPGVLFSLYYILIEYPKRLSRLYGRGGYIRIEERGDENDERAPSLGNGGQPLQQTNGSQEILESLLEPLANSKNGSSNDEVDQSQPPNYEDVVGSSDGHRDSKLSGDNKVQS